MNLRSRPNPIRRDAGPTDEAIIDRMGESVRLHIPIEGQDGSLCGFLALEWSKLDPLVVEIAVRSPGGHAIIERPVLRDDVRASLMRTACMTGLTIGPSVESGCTAFVFHEGETVLSVIVPSEPVWEMLRATERRVPMTNRAETQALDEAYARLLLCADGAREGDAPTHQT